jgi:hypothetical protein
MIENNGQAADEGAGSAVPVPRGTSRRPRWRRRRFLINKRYQLRVTALTVTLALVLLVFLNISLYTASVQSSRQVIAVAPEFEQYVKAQDRSMVRLILLGSLVFLVGVFLVGILETHKTAGAAYNLSKRLAEVAQGRYGTWLHLRKDDNLRDLEEPFNLMCRSLRERELSEIDLLENLAEEVERSCGDPSLAENMRGMATEKKERLA